GNVASFEMNDAVLPDFGWIGSRWQPPREPAEAHLDAVGVIALQGELRMTREELLAENPMRIVDVSLPVIVGVVILDDAANLNIGQGESLGQIFQALGLDNLLLEHLAAEICNGAVRPDGPRPDVDNILVFLRKRYLDVGVLASRFRQDLDAKVIVFM